MSKNQQGLGLMPDGERMFFQPKNTFADITFCEALRFTWIDACASLIDIKSGQELQYKTVRANAPHQFCDALEVSLMVPVTRTLTQFWDKEKIIFVRSRT